MNNAVTKILKQYFSRGSGYNFDRGEFANAVGISPRTLVNILSGNTSLTMDQMVKASDFLKVDLFKEFFGEIGRPDFNTTEEPAGNYQVIAPVDKITVHLTLQAPSKSYSKFPELLKVIKEKGKTLGFEIT